MLCSKTYYGLVAFIERSCMPSNGFRTYEMLNDPDFVCNGMGSCDKERHIIYSYPMYVVNQKNLCVIVVIFAFPQLLCHGRNACLQAFEFCIQF